MRHSNKKPKNIIYYYKYSNKIVTVYKNKPISYFHSEREPILEGDIITVFGDYNYSKWNILTGELLFQYNLKTIAGVISWGLSRDSLVYIHKADRLILNNVYNNGTVVKYINYHPEVIYLDNYYLIGCDKDNYILYNLREL